MPNERLPRAYLFSLLRDKNWFLPIAEPLHHGDTVNVVTFSPDGKRIMTVCSDFTARLWDAETGQAVGEPMQHQDTINSASFSLNGRWILTASSDRTAQIWDAESGKSTGKVFRQRSAIDVASLSPEVGRLITAGIDRSAHIWEIETGRELVGPLLHEAWIIKLVLVPMVVLC